MLETLGNNGNSDCTSYLKSSIVRSFGRWPQTAEQLLYSIKNASYQSAPNLMGKCLLWKLEWKPLCETFQCNEISQQSRN